MSNLNNNNFGKRLKILREAHYLSQAELAKALSVSRSTISSYENDARHPDYDTLIKIAEFFDVSIDYLLRNDLAVIKKSEQYLNILQEINDLLTTSPIESEKKDEIIKEVRDFFIWKVRQFRESRSSQEE
ncbi:hypothetical protein SYNTR_1708 [Candidatus Syntrophocurvum alkaliphilum]|uniref:HTH cro/C1-type domain-containing protein n=1 Tax=Candidatus Syntrophocurvum alkaliphilum TaxID=2293317 RepID=A0A6I6DDV7_9FIRM|nr:helix-turn-helix domain-containing protein [Candidatus Syntrophocurvum alkaliphilum]QGU00302.1 hypothetical protein SYNTR_1708 [Candidatus Syntrophocurvum alkaliphilum]